MPRIRNRVLAITAALLGLSGIALVAAGAWLIVLGGSWYYAVAGLGFLATSALLIRRNPAALWVYSFLVVATVAWALWEAGLDWWPLAARGDIVFLFGLLLLTPWVSGALSARARIPLIAALGFFVIVAIATWVVDPHRIEGVLPGVRAELADNGLGVSPDEWHAYGRTGFGQRYSPLADITPANVATLEVAWHYETGDERGRPGDPVETTFEVTPLKVGDLLYLCTPHQSVVALNATSGEEIWRYDPVIQDKLALQHLTCRGLSYQAPATSVGGKPLPPEQAPAIPATSPGLPVASAAEKTVESCNAKLFLPTADGRIIALNPQDGAVCADFGGGTGQIDLWANMPNRRPGGYYSTSPVVVTKDLIIVGGTVLDNVSVSEPSGVIRAYDVNTGVLVWNWDPGNPEVTEPIAQGQTYVESSPNSWSISSVDEGLGMVYIPFGNQPPDQWGGERSAAVERYGSAIVALDLDTGRVRWHFQTVHHDLWDYDVPSQPSLLDLTVGGETIPALVQSTKQGDIYVLNRRTGEPALPVREVPVPAGAAPGDKTAPTQPVSALSYNPVPLSGADMWGATMFDQLACRIAFHKLRYEGRYTPPSTEGTLVYPGNFGVFNWGSIAVDPQRQVVFATPTYLAFIARLVPREDDTTLYVQGDERPDESLPALNENFGAPFAVQLSAFTSALGLPCQAPPWGYISGADLTTGEIVWQHKNGTVRDSSPIPFPFKMGVPNLGGPIITAGGVAFLSSTLDYFVRGYDVTTGEQLWQSRLPAGGQATPMTYRGSDGRQYLVVAAGGHGSLGTKAGDDVIAYALPPQ